MDPVSSPLDQSRFVSRLVGLARRRCVTRDAFAARLREVGYPVSFS